VVVWAAIVLDGVPVDVDGPNRRAAASTIHPIGESGGPAGPPPRPNGAARAPNSAANPVSLAAGATGATTATAVTGATAACGATDALLVIDVAAGGVALGLAAAALRADAEVSVDPDPEWLPPVEDWVDSALAVLTVPADAAAVECSKPPFFTGLTTTSPPPVPVLVSSRSSVPEAAAVVTLVAGVDAVPDGFVDPDAVEVELVAPAAVDVELVPDDPDAVEVEVVPDDPDAVEVEVVPDDPSLLVEDSNPGAAHATHGAMLTADPMPNATANAPTRPTCFADPMSAPRRS
jgi:hypothetical protein